MTTECKPFIPNEDHAFIDPTLSTVSLTKEQQITLRDADEKHTPQAFNEWLCEQRIIGLVSPLEPDFARLYIGRIVTLNRIRELLIPDKQKSLVRNATENHYKNIVKEMENKGLGKDRTDEIAHQIEHAFSKR